MKGVICFFLGVLVTICVYCWAVYKDRPEVKEFNDELEKLSDQARKQ